MSVSVSATMGSRNAHKKLTRIRKFSEIPGPPKLPIWGNLFLYKLGIYKIEEYHSILIKLFKRYGPLVREDFGLRNIVIHAFDLADAKTVFANENSMPRVEPLLETNKFYREKKNMSLGLGNTNGEEWYKLRSAVRKFVLRPKEVQRYLPQVNQITDDLIQRLRERRDKETGEVFNLRQEIGKWSREVSGWICFEKRLGCFDKAKKEEEAAKMIEINKKMFEISSQLKFSLPIYKLIQTPKLSKLLSLEDTMHKFVTNLTLKSMNHIKRNVNGSGESDLLMYLISKNELNDKDIEVLIQSIFGDGLSTTVPSLIYNLYCLAINTNVQEKVREEVKAVVGENYVSSEAINKLHFLKAVVKETFRLYPIGTEIVRIIQNDLILSNYHVPRGTHVHLNQIVHYKSEQYFRNPERFYPERWLRNGDEEIDPFLVTPFGHGNRTCAGRRFAEQDLYVSLSKILLSFRLEYPHDASPLQQNYQILLFPEEPIRIKFKPINN